MTPLLLVFDMGNCRFIYDNLITSETMLTVSSLRPGLVSAALKDSTAAVMGSASMTPSGSFSGGTDLEYIAEIDSIAGGTQIGEATFKWSDGSGAWNATGVLTSGTNNTLNNGVQVQWATGGGTDFAVGDKWYFKAWNFFNAGKMLDMNRDTRYRSAALESPNTITVDLVTEKEIKALILSDHNLTAGTIVLEGDDADTFDSDGGNPQVSESVTFASDQILHYLTAADTTKRYWRLKITNTANPDGYIEIGELFLGPYLQLSKNHIQGGAMPINFIMDKTLSPYGIKKSRFYNQGGQIGISIPSIPAVDLASLQAMIDFLGDRESGILKKLWWNEDSAYPADTWMVEIEGMGRSRSAGSNTLSDVAFDFDRVLRSL